MKYSILVLAAVLCSQAALAQSDDYDQAGFPAPAIPAGEQALDSIKEIKISEATQLYTYRINGKLSGKGQTTAYSHIVNQVSCSLSGNADASNFIELARHNPGSGVRFTVAPKKSIKLQYRTSSGGVEQVKPACNGEPELCETHGNVTYAFRTNIILADKSGSEWKLSCLAPFSRELYVSDVKVNGLQIK